MTYTPTIPLNQYLAVDPVALLLPNEVYLNWVEMRHPHVPKVEEIGKLLAETSLEERTFIFGKIEELKKIVNVFEEAAATIR